MVPRVARFGEGAVQLQGPHRRLLRQRSRDQRRERSTFRLAPEVGLGQRRWAE